jgi:hypothetical protein
LNTCPLTAKVVIVERGDGLPDRGDNAAHAPAGGKDYLGDAKRRSGSPQFIHPHLFLQKGWQLVNEFLPGVDEAAHAAGAIKMNAMADFKEARWKA